MEIDEVVLEHDADLKFFITTDSVGYLGAQFGPHSAPYQGSGIYVRLGGNLWTDSLDPGGFGFITIIHELGHAMGLSHPHDGGGASTNFPGIIYYLIGEYMNTIIASRTIVFLNFFKVFLGKGRK